MRQLTALIVLGSLLSLAGCSTTPSPPAKAETPTRIFKCETCGIDFYDQAGIVDHLGPHPDHKVIPVQ